MVSVLIVNHKKESGVVEVVEAAFHMHGINSYVLSHTIDENETIQHLLETTKPDMLILHDPIPLEKFTSLVQQSGLANNTIVMWGKSPGEQEEEEARRAFHTIGVPLKQIVGIGNEQGAGVLIDVAKRIDSPGHAKT